MSRELRAVIVDGFVDEPACLGVPPYLSPQIRAAAGAAADAGAEDFDVEDGVAVVPSGSCGTGRPYPRPMSAW